MDSSYHLQVEPKTTSLKQRKLLLEHCCFPQYPLELQLSYDGDIDQASQSQLDGQGRSGLGLRATVDGDARRRRYSSDEEDSVKELSRTQESHLQSYQQSTLMKPGTYILQECTSRV